MTAHDKHVCASMWSCRAPRVSLRGKVAATRASEAAYRYLIGQAGRQTDRQSDSQSVSQSYGKFVV